VRQRLFPRPQQLLGRCFPEGVLNCNRSRPGDGIEVRIAERHGERQMARAQGADVRHERLGREPVDDVGKQHGQRRLRLRTAR
jgi:hypothetical protein